MALSDTQNNNITVMGYVIVVSLFILICMILGYKLFSSAPSSGMKKAIYLATAVYGILLFIGITLQFSYTYNDNNKELNQDVLLKPVIGLMIGVVIIYIALRVTKNMHKTGSAALTQLKFLLPEYQTSTTSTEVPNLGTTPGPQM